MSRRFFTPLVLIAAAVGVGWYNSKGGAVMVFPFVDVIIPGIAGDAEAMGRATTGILGGLGAATLARALWRP